MRRYNERIYRVTRSMLRDDAEAEDVMQQAYVNAYANLRQFNGRALFSTWLTRIAINEALARLRRRGRYQPLDDDPSNVETFSPRQPTAIPSSRRLPASSAGYWSGQWI